MHWRDVVAFVILEKESEIVGVQFSPLLGREHLAELASVRMLSRK